VIILNINRVLSIDEIAQLTGTESVSAESLSVAGL